MTMQSKRKTQNIRATMETKKDGIITIITEIQIVERHLSSEITMTIIMVAVDSIISRIMEE